MKHLYTEQTEQMSRPVAVRHPINRFTTLMARSLMVIGLFLFLGTSYAGAQAAIRISTAQGRVTVPVNSGNSTTITNFINLLNGGASANFDVAGLPTGATAVLTDTNGNSLLSTTMDTNLWVTVNTTNVAEGIYIFTLDAGGLDTNGVPITNSFPFVLQVAHLWNGTLNNTNNWSSAGSWLGGVPGAADDVVFVDQGAQTNNFSTSTGIPFTNSYVDQTMTVASLRFAQTGLTNLIATNPPPFYHHVHIAGGKTLTISGTNGFTMMRDYFDDAAADLGTMDVSISGETNSRVILSNLTASATVFVGGSLNPTLNMTNLPTLIVDVNRVGFSEYQLYPNYRGISAALNVGHDTNTYSGRPRQMTQAVYLAQTNLITATYVDPQNYTNELSRGYAFTLDDNEQSGVGSGQTGQLFILGATNRFLMDSICFYGANGSASSGQGVSFGFTNGGAVFRNTDGVSRMSVFTESDDGGTNEASSNVKGFINFGGNNGFVDILADRFYLSRDRELISTNQTPNVQADLAIGRGKVNVNTAILGYQEHTKPDWTKIGGGQPYLNYCQGRLVITNGGIFTVNGTMTLGYTADTNAVADALQYDTLGQVTIGAGSTVMASNIMVDGGLNYFDVNGRQNAITINSGGNLIVSNGIGSDNFGTANTYPAVSNPGAPGLPLDTLTMGASSILTLFVTPGQTNVFVRTFNSSGSTPGIINIASLPVFPVYPTNITLISYGAGAPFLAAQMPASAGSVQGYILNNAPNGGNGSIALFLTTNPPVALTWRGYVDGNWNLSTPNWVTTNGTQTTFAMGDVAVFDDSSSVTNVTISDVVVPNQSTNGAGVVISNSVNQYTFASFGGGSIAGTAQIVKEGTNLVSFSAAETGPINITAGTVNVTGLLGTTTVASNTVLNVLGGGTVGGLTSAGLVSVVAGGIINGSVILQGGSLVNDGNINTPGTSLSLVVTNNAVLTNNSDGTIAMNGSASPQAEVYAGTTLANFGTINTEGGRLFVDGFYFGTGTYNEISFDPNGTSAGRLQMDSTTSAVISPGATPGTIGNINVGARLDMHASSPENNVGTLLLDVDAGNTNNDTITCVHWNNIGCIWQINNLNGAFTSGEEFRILVNENGVNIRNPVDTADLYPLIQPTVPGPGLQWHLTDIEPFGTLGVTNCTMVWTGGGNSSWDTNGSTGNWSNSQVYGDGQGAIFDDTASDTNVNLTTVVAPVGYNIVTVTNTDHLTFTNVVQTSNAPAFMPGIIVNNSSKNYTISGPGNISGMTSIYKTGSGTLTLLTSNSFTGGMILDGGGTLAITNTTALGMNPTGQRPAWNQIIMNNATLNYFGTLNLSLGWFLTFQQNGATFEVSSSTNQLTLNSSAVGSGSLTKTGQGTLILNQTGDLYAGGTTVSQGTFELAAAAAGFGGINLAGNGVTLALTNALSITNAMSMTSSGAMINTFGTNTTTFSGPWSGNGIVTNITTNVINHFVFNGNLSGFGGTMSFGPSLGTYSFNSKTNDVCTGSAAATFDLGSGSATLNTFNGGGLTYNLGALAGGANSTLSGSTTNLIAPGTTYSIGANGNNTVFSGRIINGLDTVSVVKVGAGSLLLDGASTYTGSTVVSNGFFGGNGSIASPLTVMPGATLTPGDPIGTFTVNNTATLNGTILMQLNQDTSDMLSVSGAITASGSLIVTNIGPNIANGTTFHLFNKAVTGLTDTLPATDPTGTKTYTWTDHVSTDGSITLNSGGVNPAPTNIVTSVSGNVLSLGWPSDHTGWTLQAQTNPLTTGISTNWVNVTGSSLTNMINMTVNPTNGAVFYRLLYQP
jgi:autotransporter-associated beta strand protein